MKLYKKIIKSLFFAAFLSQIANANANTDIDLNKDGLVDEEHYSTNLLLNGDFTQSGESWTTAGLVYVTEENKNDVNSTVLASEYRDKSMEGTATQVVALASIGFSDAENLDAVLSNNQMKVVFGAWHATKDMNSYLSEVTLSFLDVDGNAFGEGVVLSQAGTSEYKWQKREGEAVIPEGTRAISYKVRLNKTHDYGHFVRVDDAFLFIQPAEDHDLDSVLDSKDIDINNDGLVDETRYTTNLLANGDFTQSGESWATRGLAYIMHQNQNDVESAMLVSASWDNTMEGTATQVVNLASVGFGDTTSLDAVLANNEMKVVFGAWHSTKGIYTYLSEITLTFLDEDGNPINKGVVLGQVGTVNYEWKKREEEAVIPVGTRALSYNVRLNKEHEFWHPSRIDNAFLHIQPAEDNDLDSVLDYNDVDKDDNGTIDEDSYVTNLLANNDFAKYGEHWERVGLVYITSKSIDDTDSVMLTSADNKNAREGRVTQIVSLASVGFGDNESLDKELANNKIKAIFGAHHSTSDMTNDLSEISLTFLDENGNPIGDRAVSSEAGTVYGEWQKRTAETIVPAGTRAFSYSVYLNKSRRDGHRVKIDDTFLHIQPATDSDLDSVLDYNDVDKDNDGVIDADSYFTNLLANGDYSQSGESWTMVGLAYIMGENRENINSAMLSTARDQDWKVGTARQIVTLASAGFSGEEGLDAALANNQMKVIFGAWHSSKNMNGYFSEISLTFLDEDGNEVGERAVLSDAGTNNYEWRERTAEAVIPTGTRALSYSIRLNKTRDTGHHVKVDDAFIYIHDISDPDNDGLGYTAEISEGTDPNDADTDNDGIPDGIEYLNGLNPLNRRDGNLDQDNDGFSNFEEFSLGTDINTDDTDGDGIPDRSDNLPTQPNVIVTGIIDVVDLGDIDNDAINDYAVVESDEEGTVTASVLSGGDIYLPPEKSVRWANKYQTPHVIILDDMTGNGVPDIGVFGVIEQQDEFNNTTLKPRLEVKDPVNGDTVRFNWPANWMEVSVIQLDDVTGDGHKDIGLQGRFINGGLRPQLVVKEGLTGENGATYSFPNLFKAPRWHQHSDMNGDGVSDISISGQLLKNGKTQVKVVNAKMPDDLIASYNFPNKWNNVTWNRLADINGDTVVDWGLLGQSKDDGRIQLFTKDGNEVRGTLGIYAWPEGMQDVEIGVTPDLNFDGVEELMLSGFRTDVQRHQISVKSGSNRSDQLLRLTWADNYSEVSYHVLSNVNGDNMASFALLGRDDRANQYVLSIAQVDSALSSETTQINLGASWSKPPIIKLLNDDNNDGMKELLFIGKDSSNELMLRKVSSPF